MQLAPMVEEFVHESLAFSPVSATSAGYHRHRGVSLDDKLDDYSPASIDRQRRFYQEFRQKLAGLRPEQLAPAERADHEIVAGQIELAELELNTIQSYRHNPTQYVELIGNALFTPYMQEYAPKAERYRHIIGRLEAVPGLIEQARTQLVDAPEIWNATAREENQGNIGLIDRTLREGVPAELKADYDRAAAKALDALSSFDGYLGRELAAKTSDWRLGKEKYARKFRLTLGASVTPEQLLEAAEAELKTVRKQMWDLSLPLHKRFFPTHRDPVDLNLIVGETLNRVSERHSSAARYFADARSDLEEARRFVQRRNLVPLPARDNLQVIETPEFMRGIYSVGGFNPAPPLEPALGAYYWLTPIPAGWPKERVESKLREYNYYGLKLLTIHEAMPGHYVQFEYANDIQPAWRRLLRALYGNGPYIEGWAIYATETMLDEGYLDGSPELRLIFLKQQLRMIANAILDIRLQTMGMTDEEAMKLMLGQAFQEKEEASAKLRRAKLSSTQLPTYYAGWRDWRRLRQLYQQWRGGAFNLGEFHESALKLGAVPVPVAATLLTGKPL